METETQISTPVDTAPDTATTVEPEVVTTTSDTSADAPDAASPTAETETPAEPLYAGKYKTVEDLENGYAEAQKFVSKAAEFEKKYNELLEKQAQDAQAVQAKKLENAQIRGFNSVEAQEIAEKVQLAEFEYFANNLDVAVTPEYFEAARSALLQYYQTGHKAFLDEAKRYYNSDFIESVALQKAKLEHKLTSELTVKQAQERDKQTAQLAEELKANFAEFLTDIAVNEGKAKALKSFCDVGSINSKEDMQIFQEIYSQIAKYEREQAIKEYEAQKNIDDVKNRSTISQNSNNFVQIPSIPTYEDIQNMSQDEYNAAVEKYGLATLLKAQ